MKNGSTKNKSQIFNHTW